MKNFLVNPLFKKALLVVGLIAIFFVGFFLSYYYLKILKSDNKNTPAKKPAFDIPEAKELPPSDYNILLLGYGGEGHDGATLSDVLMIINISPSRGKVNLVSIPRDLWVSVPVRSDLKEKHKINSAFAIGSSDRMYGLKEPKYTGKDGGGTMAKDIVSEISGLKIDYYLAVNFGNFVKIIDLLGGIDVVVPQTFDDFFYPVKGLENETCGFTNEQITEFHQKYSGFELEKQFTCRYEHIHFDAGSNHIDGVTALKFVRSRHSDQHGGDFARSERQKAVLTAIKDKIISVSAIKSAKEIFNQFVSLVQTDVNLETFGGFVKLIGEPSGYSYSFSGLSTDNVLINSRSSDGQYILVPRTGDGNWKEVKEYIDKNIKGEMITPAISPL